jgi:probable F420-dependent oxidoreductase
MAAADATSSLRIGALVWDNDYKHPVVLAKELATLDLLSEGRLEVGIGAGWMIADYERSGIHYDAAPVRIDRFVEGLAIVKGAFAPGPFSHHGQHYTINNYDGLPKPVQSPRPPILIGGGGKRVLGIAAREADIVGVNGTLHAGYVGPDALATMTAEAVDEKVALVRAAAGDRMAAIELNIRVFLVQVTDDPRGAIDGIASALQVEPALVERSPFVLIGPPSKLVEDVLERRERWGFSYLVVGGGDDIEAFAPVVAELAGR